MRGVRNPGTEKSAKNVMKNKLQISSFMSLLIIFYYHYLSSYHDGIGGSNFLTNNWWYILACYV